MRLDHITKDHVEGLRFGGSAANLNCAPRTLRRTLHKGEERNLLIKVPKFKLWPEHGRKLRLDDNSEEKLLTAAKSCNWKPEMFGLFRDVIILAKDSGMSNGRELYRIRTENLDWNNRIIFVPDSKTFRSFTVWSLDGPGKAIPTRTPEGSTPRGSRLVLRTTRLRDEGLKQYRQSDGGDDYNGA